MPEPTPAANPAPTPAANPNPAPAKVDAAPAQPQASAARPDFLPENYWDAAKGAPKLDALYNELTAKQTELARFESISAQAPAKAEDYKVALPKEFKAPEGVTIEIDEKAEEFKDLLAGARAWAHQNRLSQAQFEGQLGLFAQFLAGTQAKAVAARDAEMKAIGENAGARITAVEKFVTSALPKEQAAAVLSNLTSKAALEGFEALIRKAIPAGATTQGPAVNGAAGDKYEGMFGARRRAAQLADQKQRIRA